MNAQVVSYVNRIRITSGQVTPRPPAERPSFRRGGRNAKILLSRLYPPMAQM